MALAMMCIVNGVYLNGNSMAWRGRLEISGMLGVWRKRPNGIADISAPILLAFSLFCMSGRPGIAGGDKADDGGRKMLASSANNLCRHDGCIEGLYPRTMAGATALCHAGEAMIS